MASLIFFNRIIINKPARLKQNGPLLLACNHPNSFLDAILLDILFKNPIWSLARGDVFKKPFHKRLLKQLNMLPVYRTREGVENLEHNYKTFDACKEIFASNGLVLIFSEGLCINEWHLRPLKKGTARLALSAWQEGIPLTVLPVGINYSSFKKIGKNVFINFGELITVKNFDLAETDGKLNLQFNQLLQAELQPLVYEIPNNNKEVIEERFTLSPNRFVKAVLFFPAMIGYIVNAPFYFFASNYVSKRLKEPGHYDSVLLAVLSFFYPVYALSLSWVVFFISGTFLSFLMLLLLPVLAKAYIIIKKKTD